MPNAVSIFSAPFKFAKKNRLIYILGSMILFFMLFDGIIAYLIPLLVTEHGISKTMLGIVLASAAISGAFFDLVIYKIFKEAIYRRLFMAMFAVALAYIFMVWVAEILVLYIVAMAMWGFYYDLKNFGTLDFVSRHSPKKEISSNFGILQVFQSIGFLLAPLIAGFLIIDIVDWEPFAAALVFLATSSFFFVLLLHETRRKRVLILEKKHTEKRSIWKEFARWKKVGNAILPVLLLASFSTVFDSFFMAIGPILGETLPLEPFDGFFMFAYFLPPLVIGGLIGSITSRFGEKRTAIFGLLIGASILTALALFQNPLIIIFIVFASSCFTCVMAPVVQSIYAHCIHDAPKIKKEVQELGDLFLNFGYVIGPVFAGIIADNFGNSETFSILGVIGVVCALLFLVYMPEKINVKIFRGRQA